ncbi:MAG TPA: LAGLIDADG family homing endonuclease, partial [Herpetosiphonaceae bacterium]|nr:LAGLIDADG family homing endonuclease [Herpetosiphonaceae bacterium]
MARPSMAEILGPGGLISRRLPGYESRPTQVAMAETVATALETGRHAIIEGGTGVGKALDVDTPIATPTGWKRMGDLYVGDMVFDETGMPTEVVGAFDIMYNRPCYEIELSDGSTLVADEEHEWITYTWRDRKRASRRREAGPRHKHFATGTTLTRIQSLLDTTGTIDTISVTDTERLIGGHTYSVWRATQDLAPTAVLGRRRLYTRAALLAAVLARLESDVDHRRPDAMPFSRLTTRDIASTLTVTIGNAARLNHAIPVAPALVLPDRDLPIDPGILGLWLGDGSANNGQLTTADPELIRGIEEAGYIVRKLGSRYRYSLHLPSGPARSRWEPGLVGALRDLGVLNNKHIPLCYLRASEGQRRALLAGLLDTDGTVSLRGGIEYTSTNPRLARDVQALICSLGYRPSMTTKPARLRGQDCGVAYTIVFTTSDRMFRLPRKIAAHEERLRNYTPVRNEFRYITDIRPVPSRPVRCIQVAAASHLYLAGEALIPTHNSLAYLIPAIYSGKKVIISTANKALQDQLVGKDIPFLQHALPREVTAALVKGRSNYLCLDRLDEEERFQTMAGPSPDYRRLKAWAAGTRTGDFEDLPTLPARDLLGRVSSTARTCIGSACQYFFGECFVEKMRARAEKASLVVCNHALLLADLVVRDMGAYLLPDRDAVIIDEAHRLEETALDAFTRSLSRRDIAELAENTLLRRYVGEVTVARLPDLAEALFRPLELPVQPGDRRWAIGGRNGPALPPTAYRLPPTSYKLTEQLDGGLRLAEALAGIAERLIRQDPFRDTKTSTRESRHYEKLVEWTSRLAEDARLISTINDEDSVRYVEHGAGPRFAEVTAKWTPVDVSEPLAEILFRQTPVICTSATLAVGDFSYFRRAVGIADAAELVAPSPFDYPRQCLLYVPSHLPEFRG